MSDSENDSAGLLPCPFCGGKTWFSEDTSGDYQHLWDWWVECQESECMAEIRGATKEAAFSKWNRRNGEALASEGLPAAPCYLPNNHEASTRDK